MKLRNIFVLLACFMIFSGCEKTELGKKLDCKIGNTYKITDDLSFLIYSLNDSRCPPNADCFAAGDVYINLNIYHSNTQIDTTMYLRDTSRNPIQIGDYAFKVLDVSPLLGNGLSTSKEFTIKMIVTKN
jgi:hypothetical protein